MVFVGVIPFSDMPDWLEILGHVRTAATHADKFGHHVADLHNHITTGPASDDPHAKREHAIASGIKFVAVAGAAVEAFRFGRGLVKKYRRSQSPTS